MTIAEIQAAVARRFCVTTLDLRSARRSRNLVRPRHIAMWMARHLTLCSIPEIGRHFGDRDHSTVTHAVERIDNLIRTDRETAAIVWALVESVDCAESVEIRRAVMRLVA